MIQKDMSLNVLIYFCQFLHSSERMNKWEFIRFNRFNNFELKKKIPVSYMQVVRIIYWIDICTW